MNREIRNALRTSIAAAAILCMAATARADIITVDASDLGTPFTINYDGFADGLTIPGLSAQTVFTLSSLTDTSFTFDYSVTNTSTNPITGSRISIFGFNTNPEISGASSTGLFNEVAFNSNVPSGFGTVDLCFKSGGGPNCSGGGGDGVAIGDTATGTFTLNFASALDELSLSDFFVRYQSITGQGAPGSAIGRGTVGGSSGGTPVPAPAALWLFAGALGAVGWRYGGKRVRTA